MKSHHYDNSLLTLLYRINNGMHYYILTDPDKPNQVKLGITKNLTNRIKGYRTGAPQSNYYKVYNNVDKRHEKKILDIMRDIYRVDREVVYCNAKIISNIIDSYFVDQNLTTK